MRWKTMFLTIVVNIFLMLLVTLFLEYSDLSERFVSLEDSVQEALDMAIDASVKSEEFFSEKYQSEMMSYAASSNGGAGVGGVHASVLLWIDDDNSFHRLNTYGVAMYFNNYGRLPRTDAEANEANNYVMSGTGVGGAEKVFKFLYGECSTDYNNPSLSWANRNWSRKIEYASIGSIIKNGRSAYSTALYNRNFKEFYDSVGKYQMTTGYLKEKKDANSYKLTLKTYPTLANMGFPWMTTEYNKVDSQFTNDNFSSSAHIGKTRLSSKKTVYFLTPMSLGVTYIPTEVLKPTFEANLDTLVRLNRLGGNSNRTVDTTDAGVRSTLSDASKCIETSVYTLGGTNHKQHKSGVSERIVTDGLVEYDLNSTKVKIDYFYFDFGSASLRTTAEKVISKVNGTLKGYSTEAQARSQTLNSFINADSGSYVSDILAGTFASGYSSTRNGRIVAKVTVRIKVHVPYKSAIMQWMCERTTPAGAVNHYDIKLWNPSAGHVDVTSDGTWYQYSTYYCTSRS